MSRDFPCIYYENQRCKKYSDENINSWCVLGPCADRIETNADRIRAMSDEEMARFLDRVQEEECSALHEVRQDGTLKFASLRNGWLAWLQQPAEEVDHV